MSKPPRAQPVPPVAGSRRRDIQGLRAVAVAAVIAFHLTGWPSGGFLGVDVFFVVSGFVITQVLLRRAPAGRVGLGDFYVRRVRRILPLGLVVLGVTVVAARLTYSREKADGIALDALAAALFVGNWRFAWEEADYFNLGAEPSPIQHYWSLGVEEQFYFVWPGLLLLVALAAGYVTREQLRRAVPRVAAAVVLLSVAFGAWQTRGNPVVAYYSSFTRAWELALGCWIAALPAHQLFTRTSGIMARLGLTGVAVALLVTDSGSRVPVPGSIAACLATVLVLRAGAGEGYRDPWTLGNPVACYVGDLSYGLYLWHFPVAVIGASWLGRGPAWLALSAGLTLVLAAITHHLVERPIMNGRVRPRELLASGTALAVLVASFAGAAALAPGWWDAAAGTPTVALAPPATPSALPSASPSVTPTPSPSATPAASPTTTPSPTPTVQPTIPADQPVPLGTTGTALQEGLRQGLALGSWPADLTPSTPADGAVPWEGAGACQSTVVADKSSCTFGKADGPEIVVLGDSLGINTLSAAVNAFGKTYRVRGLTKVGCNVNGAKINYGAPADICINQRAASIAYINSTKPQVVFVTETYNFATRLASKATGAARVAEWAAADRSLVAALKPSGTTVVFVSPSIDGVAFNDCYRSDGSPQRCTTGIPSWWPPLQEAERNVPGSRFVDTLRWYCVDGRCPMVSTAAGAHTLMKRDYIHVTYAYDVVAAADLAYQVQAMGLLR